MSICDAYTPTYKFSLRIESEDRVLVDASVAVEATSEGIERGKGTILGLLSEYAPVAEEPTPAPEPPAPETPHPAGQIDPPKPKSAPAPPPEKKPEGVRGLLRLHCPECGNTFGIFLRENQTEVTCKCGHHIDLTAPLAKFRFVCPSCQQENWGKTNLEDPEIKCRCRCGEDVTMDWVPKAKEYQN